jgi:hypothetical protein
MDSDTEMEGAVGGSRGPVTRSQSRRDAGDSIIAGKSLAGVGVRFSEFEDDHELGIDRVDHRRVAMHEPADHRSLGIQNGGGDIHDDSRMFARGEGRDFPAARGDNEWRVGAFDGKQDWRSYFAQFKLLASYNRWTTLEQALHLAKSLQGQARTILADMTPEQMAHLPTLVAAIERRYQPRERTLAHKALFNSRRQGAKEDVSTFGEALRLLALQAFPNLLPAGRECRMIDRFLEGLQDTELRKHLYLQHFETFDAVLSAAIEWEALDEAITLGGARKPRMYDRVAAVTEQSSGNKQAEEMLLTQMNLLAEKLAGLEASLKVQQSTGSYQNQNARSQSTRPKMCYYCSKEGHTKKSCPLFLSTIMCFKCKQHGHFASDCSNTAANHMTERQQVLNTVRLFHSAGGEQVAQQQGNY